VVGGGLAGLTCAYRLRQAGYVAEVHEATDRIGGRCWTLRGAFADGQSVECGGEFIDSNHREIRALCQEFGLLLVSLPDYETTAAEPLYYFDGKPYTLAEVRRDYKACRKKISDDVAAAGYPTTYYSHTRRGRELDQISVADYIDKNVEGRRASRFGHLLEVAYTIECGGEAIEQSSLNLLYPLGSSSPQFEIFGESDERFWIEGGNDQLAAAMTDVLEDQITLNSELVAVKQNADNTYALSFEQDNRTKTFTADKAVLALPFSVLRSSVDLSGAGFTQLKLAAIAELGMGTNSKLFTQFTNRFWETLGSNGETFADTGYQSTWDTTRAQSGNSGILVNYTGGNIGESFGSGTTEGHAERFLKQMEPVLPGIAERWNRRAALTFWPGHRWAKGSYSYLKVGQYTTLAGVERERQGNCHFAGEHTSVAFRGYLNGAVESGERAANEILADLIG